MSIFGETKPAKKPVLGISLYPEQESMEEIESYIQMASKYGFTKIFTSMFSVPGTKEEVFNYFKNFTNIAHKYGMIVDGDCNTEFLKTMGASEKDLTVFKEMGIDVIRMDLPFFDERDVELINNPLGIQIELSACMVDAVRLALKNGANPKNFTTCHNFYPERYTAADLDSIVAVNNELNELGIPVAVFISSNNPAGTHGPWPVNDGLPTVEDHRWIPAELQLRHWISVGGVDEILFGNAFASEEEFKAIDEVMKATYRTVPENKDFGFMSQLLPHGDLELVPFRVVFEEGVSEIERKAVLDSVYHQAGEYTYYMIRSRWTRVFYSNTSIEPRESNQEYYHRGDIVIVNDNLKHYRGEVQIVLRDMKVDGQRNLIGHIPPEELILLDEIKPGRSICFLK